jgi:hypothetical protein
MVKQCQDRALQRLVCYGNAIDETTGELLRDPKPCEFGLRHSVQASAALQLVSTILSHTAGIAICSKRRMNLTVSMA